MRKWNFGRVLLIVAALIAVIGSVLYVLLDGTDKTFALVWRCWEHSVRLSASPNFSLRRSLPQCFTRLLSVSF